MTEILKNSTKFSMHSLKDISQDNQFLEQTFKKIVEAIGISEVKEVKNVA